MLKIKDSVDLKGGRVMIEDEMFIQYWFCTNKKVLMINELKDALYKIWLEVVEKFKNYNLEDKWFRVGDYYKERIIKGV